MKIQIFKKGIIDFNFLIQWEDKIVEVPAEQTTDLNSIAEPHTEVHNIYMNVTG